MMQLVQRREAQNKRHREAIADIEDLAFKVVSPEEKRRQQEEREKNDFSPIPEKKRKKRSFKLSSAKKSNSDADDVVSSVMDSPPGSLGKIKMRNRGDIDASATRIQDETNDNFKLRQVEEDPLVKESETARNQTGPNSPADDGEDSYTEAAPT